ncbi:RNase HII [Lachnospiraceae bacterium NK3A20]|jgi:ribonuclease HII|nr:RNase HII [Lachnospiraceae bacterium NK3A20]
MTRKEEAAAKRLARQQQEISRVAEMRAFEREAILDKFGPDFFPELAKEEYEKILICGIDEAGRGPLAGPVAAGAVILPKDHDILHINDSKKLSAKRRAELFDTIREEAIAWNVGLATPERIDEINILQATFEAMRSAVAGLGIQPDVLVIDAVTIPGMKIPEVPIIKGDAKCLSVAAASILAKVTRDRMMEEYDRQYPEYGFARHKGYGTAEHIAALKEYGPCPIHRRSFITHFVEEA